MSAVAADFLEGLLQPAERAGNPGDATVKARRAHALERASQLAVPTTRDEEWRFTDLTGLYRVKFKPATEAGQADDAILRALLFPDAPVRLVFVDGFFNAAASNIRNDSGVSVDCLGSANAVEAARTAANAHLATIAEVDQDLFAAANTAYLQQAAVVHVSRGVDADKTPVQLLHVSTGRETRVSPRILVVAEREARCTVVEDYVALGGAAYFTNSVCEIAVGPGAQVRHIKLQREAETAFHIANTSVRMQADARYRNWSISLGGRISRHNLNVYQAGSGIDCEMHGLTLLTGRQVGDTHSAIDHAYAHGTSRQMHKTITSGSGHAVFNGKIIVREGAQQTNSAQQSRNLLLSPRATVDTKPQLEIFADDVKCAHGATVGQMDAEELFYLKSRGLSESAARNLLTYAFAREVVEDIPVTSLISVLESHILEQTRGTEAG